MESSITNKNLNDNNNNNKNEEKENNNKNKVTEVENINAEEVRTSSPARMEDLRQLRRQPLSRKAKKDRADRRPSPYESRPPGDTWSPVAIKSPRVVISKVETTNFDVARLMALNKAAQRQSNASRETQDVFMSGGSQIASTSKEEVGEMGIATDSVPVLDSQLAPPRMAAARTAGYMQPQEGEKEDEGEDNIEVDEDSLDEEEETKEKRKRGRPPETGEYVNIRERREEQARIEKEEELNRRAEAALSSDPPSGTGWEKARVQEMELEEELFSAPTNDIIAQLLQQSNTIFKVADCSNKMKGSLVGQLRQAAIMTRAAVNVMMTRSRESTTSELSEIRRELERLRLENKSLRRELGRLKEASQTPLSPYPTLQESVASGSSRKRRRRARISDSEGETEDFSTSNIQREVSPPLSPSLSRSYSSIVRGRKRDEMKKTEVPSSLAPAPTISGPTLRGVPRPVSVYPPGMGAEEIAQYEALLDKMNPILSQMEALRISAAQRTNSAAPVPSPRASLITGGEVQTSRPQRMRKEKTALNSRLVVTSVTKEEVKTSTSHGDSKTPRLKALLPASAPASQTEEPKKKKKKKKKKMKESQGIEGPSSSVTGAQRAQERQKEAMPPQPQKGSKTPASETSRPLGKKEILNTKVLPPGTQRAAIEEGWTMVGKGRKDKGKGEGNTKRANVPQNSALRVSEEERKFASSKSLPRTQPSPASSKKKGKKRRRAPRTAAVVITCDAGDYKNNLQHAVKNINLAELGINGMGARRALTGAQLFEIRGPDHAQKADALAERLREVMAGRDGVRITRPMMTAEVRVRDLDDSVEPQDVANAVANIGGCSPGDIKTGVIQFSGRGLGTLWVRCPAAVAGKLVAARRIRVGWVNARVEELEPRPLQCHRCLEKGHVRAKCCSSVSRADCCYRCGKEGHLARDCKSPVRCPICAGRGRPDNHRAGSRACTAPKRKGSTTQPAPRTIDSGPPVREAQEVSREESAPPLFQEVEMLEEREAKAPPLPQRKRWAKKPLDYTPAIDGECSRMEEELEELNANS